MDLQDSNPPHEVKRVKKTLEMTEHIDTEHIDTEHIDPPSLTVVEEWRPFWLGLTPGLSVDTETFALQTWQWI